MAVVIFSVMLAQQDQWRGLDPRLAKTMSPQSKASVWCDGLRTPGTTPDGMWTSMGRRAGMSKYEVQAAIYDFCHLPIPADDPGLLSDDWMSDLKR